MQVCDVSVVDQLNSAVAAITQDLGPIDVLIFNVAAGGFQPYPAGGRDTEADRSALGPRGD